MVEGSGGPLCLNGECIDLANGYKCHCEVGWMGEQCQSLYLPCAVDRDTPVCLNGGTCKRCAGPTDVCIDNYRCICLEGFEGYNCENTPPAVGSFQLYVHFFHQVVSCYNTSNPRPPPSSAFK